MLVIDLKKVTLDELNIRLYRLENDRRSVVHSETVKVEIGEGLKKGCEGETDVALNCQHQGYLPSRNGSPVRASSGGLRCVALPIKSICSIVC